MYRPSTITHHIKRKTSMKKFIIIYAAISVILFIFMYVMTLIEVSATKTNEAYYEIAEVARETKDVSDFIRFSTDGFLYLDTYEDDIYHIDVVLIKVSVNDTLYHQLGIFVLPKGEVSFARSLSDTNDQARAYLIDGETVIYDSDTYQDYTYPMTYGIEVIGFYFYAFEFETEYHATITLFDYEGELIYENSLILPITYDASLFIEGFTDDELASLIGADEAFQSIIIDRITLFIVVDIVLIGIIIFIWKWIRRKP